jgi:hypothetical protein
MIHQQAMPGRFGLAILMAFSATSVLVADETPAKGARSPDTAAPARGPAPQMQLWVPAYFYPSGAGLADWDRLIAAARSVPIVVTFNPASGPGDRVDPRQARIVQRARKAGIRVIAYVGTNYARKPLPRVKEEIATYLRFYPEIQGVHVDEQASDAAELPYYRELYKYVNQRAPNALILNNPGTRCASEYVSQRVCDKVCLFEHHQGFEEFRPPAWASRFSPDRFCVVVYQVDTERRIKQYIHDAARMGMGCVYITDDGGANPYDRLPSYWETEVEAIRALNEAGAKDSGAHSAPRETETPGAGRR